MNTSPAGHQNITRLTLPMTIESVDESGCDELMSYLADLSSDNGKAPTGYTLPRSRNETGIPPDKEKSFRAGLTTPIGLPGWRRAWVARNSHRQIAGHVDLRSHSESVAAHRCLLGLGVQREHRRLGVGAALLAHASEWALANTELEWIDLQVLSANESAVRLYLRAGFVKVGEVAEMFKIDGRLFSETTMTKRLRETARGDGHEPRQG
jgi:ribosomal protein S18 acetylase RimI-like enzyme